MARVARTWLVTSIFIAFCLHAGLVIPAAGQACSTTPVCGLPNLSSSVESTALNGLDGAQWMLYQDATTNPGAAQAATLTVQRNANYTGTAGTTGQAIWGITNVSSGVNSFEWAILGQISNSSTTSQAAAVYGQATKLVAGAPAFGGVFEVLDAAGANPTSSVVASQVDVVGDGADANGNRRGVDVYAKQYTTGGANLSVSSGVRVITEANSTFINGFRCDSATLSGSCLLMQQAQKITFTTAKDASLSYNGSALVWQIAGQSVATVSDAGAVTATTAHLTKAALPRISSCGGSVPAATAGSSNQGGQFTFGLGSRTCTVTFAVAYPTYAFCTLTPSNNYIGGYYISAQSRTGFTVSLQSATNSVKFNYGCNGN